MTPASLNKPVMRAQRLVCPGNVPSGLINALLINFKKKITNNFQWVVERLCKIASESSSLHARVLRIGQLVGDTQNGIWNESEAVSLIIKVRELCFRGCTGVQNRVGCTNNPSPTSSKGGMTVPSRD